MKDAFTKTMEHMSAAIDAAASPTTDNCAPGGNLKGEILPKKFTWEEAIKAVDELNISSYLGHCNWRLPSIEELISIIDYTKYDPACKLSDMVAARYWSCTTYAANKHGGAWYVFFYDGHVRYGLKAGYGYVRAVRSGPNGLEWGKTL